MVIAKPLFIQSLVCVVDALIGFPASDPASTGQRCHRYAVRAKVTAGRKHYELTPRYNKDMEHSDFQERTNRLSPPPSKIRRLTLSKFVTHSRPPPGAAAGGADPASFALQLRRCILALHSALAATPAPKAGEHLSIESPKRLPNAIEVIGVDLADLGRQAAIINRPDLIEANIFVLIAKADMHIPRALALLRRRGGDEIKAVRELPHDEDGAGEPTAFAVDFRPDVLTEGGPPQITLGYEWRFVV